MVRRRRRRSTSLGSLMIIFFLLVFLGGVVVVVSFLYRNQEKSLELTENLCPVEGPIYTLAILLDATDGVTEITTVLPCPSVLIVRQSAAYWNVIPFLQSSSGAPQTIWTLW